MEPVSSLTLKKPTSRIGPVRLQAWKRPLELLSVVLWSSSEELLGGFWLPVAILGSSLCFAETVFPAGGEVPSSGLVVKGPPTFPQSCTWYLTASGCVVLM